MSRSMSCKCLYQLVYHLSIGEGDKMFEWLMNDGGWLLKFMGMMILTGFVALIVWAVKKGNENERKRREGR